eukprot:scaffold7017_cov75-Phaeocystis_antarctica.AAC.5
MRSRPPSSADSSSGVGCIGSDAAQEYHPVWPTPPRSAALRHTPGCLPAKVCIATEVVSRRALRVSPLHAA